ncbi:MAG: hypothetical protein L0Y58_04505 [Verrucomicrobia subdivision 3 bacterium]|nr:hypothetical protein [Limisphaerales bacterium]
MNIRGNGRALAAATKELLLKWQETKAYWQDVKADEFEQQFLVGLEASVNRALPVFDDLDKLVSKVRQDCE